MLIILQLLQVLQENNVKKEELKVRALALKLLGKIFQVKYLLQVLKESYVCNCQPFLIST